MRKRIDDTTSLGKVTEEMRKEHKGFHEWVLGSNKNDHQAIIQVRHIFHILHVIFFKNKNITYILFIIMYIKFKLLYIDTN